MAWDVPDWQKAGNPENMGENKGVSRDSGSHNDVPDWQKAGNPENFRRGGGSSSRSSRGAKAPKPKGTTVGDMVGGGLEFFRAGKARREAARTQWDSVEPLRDHSPEARRQQYDEIQDRARDAVTRGNRGIHGRGGRPLDAETLNAGAKESWERQRAAHRRDEAVDKWLDRAERAGKAWRNWRGKGTVILAVAGAAQTLHGMTDSDPVDHQASAAGPEGTVAIGETGSLVAQPPSELGVLTMAAVHIERPLASPVYDRAA